MPSLFRFLFLTGIVAGSAYGGLYLVASYFEPEQRETSKTLVGVELSKPDEAPPAVQPPRDAEGEAESE